MSFSQEHGPPAWASARGRGRGYQGNGGSEGRGGGYDSGGRGRGPGPSAGRFDGRQGGRGGYDGRISQFGRGAGYESGGRYAHRGGYGGRGAGRHAPDVSATIDQQHSTPQPNGATAPPQRANNSSSAEAPAYNPGGFNVAAAKQAMAERFQAALQDPELRTHAEKPQSAWGVKPVDFEEAVKKKLAEGAPKS